MYKPILSNSKNAVVVNCSPRHVQFCEQYCDSLIKLNYEKNDFYEFIFILNDSDSIEDFVLKSNDLKETSIKFIEKAKSIGSVFSNNIYKFELGSLKYFIENINNKIHEYDQVLLMQCSYEVLQLKAFEILFDDCNKEFILGMQNAFQNYFLKIPVKYIEEYNIPVVNDKAQVIRFESNFVNELKVIVGSHNCKHSFLGRAKTRYEHKFGRRNLIEETIYFRKWKGTWDIKMLKDAWV